AVQRARQQALPARPALDAALEQAEQGMPFQPGLFKPFVDDVQKARELPLLTPQRFASSPLGQRLSGMLAQRDGHWLG
ncbi:hypothetical protein, partial [Salmonella enterica]